MEERGVLYAIRLPSNKILEWETQHLLRRPVGRPPRACLCLPSDSVLK